jgi:hypothetical protein
MRVFWNIQKIILKMSFGKIIAHDVISHNETACALPLERLGVSCVDCASGRSGNAVSMAVDTMREFRQYRRMAVLAKKGAGIGHYASFWRKFFE